MRLVFLSLFFLSCFLITGVSFADALEVTVIEDPHVIYEFQEGYHFNTYSSDGNYVLIEETQPNAQQLRDHTIEGYNYLGNLYLYDIRQNILTKVPSDVPPQISIISNGTVYWKSAKYLSHIPGEPVGNMASEEYYYQFTPGDTSPVMIPIPQNCGMIDFSTDGHHLVMSHNEIVQGSKLELTLTLFNLTSGESMRPVVLGGLNPHSLRLSGDYFVYSDSAMLVPDVNTRHIHVYNIYSGNTYSLKKEDGVGQILRDLWGDVLFYAEYNVNDDPSITNPDYFLLNLTTNVTQSIEIQKGIASKLIRPSVLVFSDVDDSTGKQVIKLATLDMPTIAQPPPLPLTMEQTLPPQPTQTGTPLGMTVGLIAFALMCILAALWRKK